MPSRCRALASAGADLITFETFLDIRELRAGVIACRDVCTLPIIAQLTFDDGGRTVLGTPPEAAAVTLDALGVDIIGSNCGLGIDGIYAVPRADARRDPPPTDRPGQCWACHSWSTAARSSREPRRR